MIMPTLTPKLPSWFKQAIPDMNKVREVKNFLTEAGLSTVCQSARCPNLGTCWQQKVATVMILGDVCTRGCRFCAVNVGSPRAVDRDEPQRVARAVRDLGLRYVVVTSVTRDDLSDGGAEQFRRTIQAIRALVPAIKIEVLVPDFQGDIESLKTVLSAAPDVLAHNLETVPRISPAIRATADYERSLELLERTKQSASTVLSKSGIMVGLGESFDEVVAAMTDLRSVDCDILTIGQYLSPSESARHVPVARFVDPAEFDEYRRLGEVMGFRSVKSGPLVRSSFLAEEGYHGCISAKADRGLPHGS